MLNMYSFLFTCIRVVYLGPARKKANSNTVRPVHKLMPMKYCKLQKQYKYMSAQKQYKQTSSLQLIPMINQTKRGMYALQGKHV